MAGLPLSQTKIRSKNGITVVAVKSGDNDFTYASAETELSYEDIVLVTGRGNDIDRLVGLDGQRSHPGPATDVDRRGLGEAMP